MHPWRPSGSSDRGTLQGFDYKEPDVTHFTTEPNKQGQADKKTDLVRKPVTNRVYRAGSIAKSTFVLSPTKWMR
jgi:hypothetical protein